MLDVVFDNDVVVALGAVRRIREKRKQQMLEGSHEAAQTWHSLGDFEELLKKDGGLKR